MTAGRYTIGGVTTQHDLTTATVELRHLRPHPRNARNGDIEAIAESLQANGQFRPIVLAADGTILAGNHTYAAAMSLGWDTIDAVRLDLDPNSPEAIKIMLADNRTANLGNYDDGLLLALLEAVEDIDGTGYTPEDLDRLHDRLNDDTPAVVNPSLADRFGVPPTSVLRMASGEWQARKRQWKEARLGRDLTTAEFVAMSEAERDPTDSVLSGTSTFDPVLCELVYRWWAPPAAAVYDPCSGGSVRGLVASTCGHQYTGIDIRPEQITANEEQATEWYDGPAPRWVLADATAPCPVGEGWADLLFTCPPYFDLEVYSDDPADLSNMTWPEFVAAHRAMIANGLAALRDDRFAVWVISDVRDKQGLYRGLVAETVAAFEAAGARLYNDLILAEPIGSQRMFAGRRLTTNRKVARVHQHVLVFVKGDPLAAHEACGPVPEGAWAAPDPDGEDEDYSPVEGF